MAGEMNQESEVTEEVTENEEAEATENTETEETETEESNDEEGYDFGDGQRFKTQKEALEYSRKLMQQKEIELAEANAYRQAAEDFRPTHMPAPVQQQETPEDWETKFYSDPKAVIADVEKKVEQRIMSTMEQKREDERLWAMFTVQHPELSEFRDEVELAISKEPKLFQTIYKTKGERAALDLAAQRVKSKIERIAEMKKPKKELGKDKQVTLQATQTSVTQKKIEEKPQTMAEQMANLNKKRRR